MGYREVYDSWLADPSGFWLEQARKLEWEREPAIGVDEAAGIYGRWFPDGICNTCHNALDRHVAAGHGERTALIYDSPVTGTKRRFSYAELLHEVKAAALMLTDLGVAAGDRVVVYMPMVPEAVISMLACARVGAIHSVVFGGFAARELAMRIEDAQPRVVLSASCGIEPSRVIPYKPLLDAAIEQSRHKPQACVILKRPEAEAALTPGRDQDWDEAVGRARAALEEGRASPCVPVPATHPLYILYTSGTTGSQKGVLRDHGGHMVALHWSMEAVYGVKPGETFWAASDVGWVVGHSYIVYAPLLAGCATVLYEGKPVGTPDAGAFWRVAAEYGVCVLFTAPTAIRAVRKVDPEAALVKEHDLSRLRALFLAGERADPDTVEWAENSLGVPVIDHWWQTETGFAIAANPLGIEKLPVRRGSPSVPMPGYRIEILDEAGQPVPPGTFGTIAIRLPLPPCALPTLWRSDQRFRDVYLSAYPGYYSTADAGMLTEDGYVWVMGRTDDVINVAGHRLSTGGIEEVLAAHPAVAECAVIGVKDDLKGEIPCGFVVLKSNSAQASQALAREVAALVRERIGAVASLKRLLFVDRLPKTRSGKILRGTMKKIADDESWNMPATIEDPAALSEIETAWKTDV
ncbi:AMP-binding protein [Aureimonas populi]|uniref:AMP-binding protein n=1 Tax=Aureimonas populi TaxID=1701758 RepID=A0ABW5CMG2_9HYPH|nr:AMP-binding protein [Aureimonas populi]